MSYGFIILRLVLYSILFVLFIKISISYMHSLFLIPKNDFISIEECTLINIICWI